MFRPLIACIIVSTSYAQYGNQKMSADRIDTIPAWYQLSSRQMTPPFTYERTEPQFERMERPALQYTKAFASYPSYGNPRQPFTEGFPHSTPALTRPVPLRRYPGGQDMPYESSISRYHKLLLRKQIWKSTQYTTTVPSISTEKKPMSLRKIYSIITPKFSQHTPLPRILPAERLNNDTSSRNLITEKWKNIIASQMGNTSITSTSTITIIPTKNATSTSVFSKIFPLPRIICKQILEKHEEKEKVRTLAPFGTLVSTWKSKVLRTTTTTQKTTVNKPASMLDYIWPNSELLAAIKDVVAKFKASLDETGIDQDMQRMGNQLKNTWQHLRTGPVNEQIGRLLEKTGDDSERHHLNQQ